MCHGTGKRNIPNLKYASLTRPSVDLSNTDDNQPVLYSLDSYLAHRSGNKSKPTSSQADEKVQIYPKIQTQKSNRQALSIWIVSIFVVVTLVIIGVAVHNNVTLHDPDVPLKTFCDAVNAIDYQTEYQQLSPNYQSTMSLTNFVQMMKQQKVIGCNGYGLWDLKPTYTLTLDFACDSSCAGRVGVTLVQTDTGMKIDGLNFNF